jgi:uncharacterized membrane protein
MVEYEQRVAIAAPAAKVWQVMSDVERWHEWTASITEIRKLDAEPFMAGARFRVKQPKLAATEWTLTRVLPEQQFVWVSRSTGVVVTAWHDIVPAAMGVEVCLRIRFEGWLGVLLGRLGGSLTRHYIQLEAQGLKQCVESRLAGKWSRVNGV